MSQSRIAKALSLIQRKNLRALVMGGQACVLYGAAEFSRDLDLALSLAPQDLLAFQTILEELGARCIAVPSFDVAALRTGHAVHFRCHAPGLEGLRIDVMHSMRGLESFEILWDRRTTLEAEGGLIIELMSLPDLVRAKKTQRDKDWPMIRRLVEAHFHTYRRGASEQHWRFWFLEARTPQLLVEIARLRPDLSALLSKERPLLEAACRGALAELETLLDAEQRRERLLDKEYWQPLKEELERLRHQRP